MKNRHEHVTAFYIETLALILSVVLVILVLTHVFGMGKLESAKAGELTDAVRLAQNAAEAFAAAAGPAELGRLLDEGGNVNVASASSQYPLPDGDRLPALIFASYDRDLKGCPEEQAVYRVVIKWEAETPKPDTLANGAISVYRAGESEGDPIYTLETAVYLQEGGAL